MGSGSGGTSIMVMLEDKKGKLDGKFILDFSAALGAREDANYRYTYSQEAADYLLKAAGDFLERMERLARK